MRLSIFSVLIPLMLLFLVIGALPMIITLIYRVFYNNHVNRVLEADTAGAACNAEESEEAVAGKTPLEPKARKKASRWISPFAVFLIALFAEILIYVAMGMVFKFNTADGNDDYPDADLSQIYETYLQSDVDDSIFYQYFDGSEVQGYARSEQSDGDINCVIYQGTDDMLPKYILRFTYTGTENVGCWDESLVSGDESAGMAGDLEGNPCVLYVIISGNIQDYDDADFTLDLYNGTLEDYSDGFGTYDTGEPVATITVDIP